MIGVLLRILLSFIAWIGALIVAVLAAPFIAVFSIFRRGGQRD